MKVLIVSGFLGAGKTTFIQELVRHLGRSVVVYENEFGDADVDAQRLRESTKLDVWETLEDCICCTGGRDFASAVLTIANSIDPEYLVVEPTGVARLSGVLANVRKVAYSRIQVLAPITVVDGVSWREQRMRARELFDDQLRSAGIIVVSKTTLAGFAGTGELTRIMRALNPTASLVDRRLDRLSKSWWEALATSLRAHQGGNGSEAASLPETSLAGGEPHQHHHHHHHADDEFQTATLRDAWLPTPAHLAWQLDALTLGAYGHVDRAKGVVTCGHEPIRFDVVAHAWAMAGDPAIVGNDNATAVFIGQHLDTQGLLDAFAAGRK